jgi:hypothetical protein
MLSVVNESLTSLTDSPDHPAAAAAGVPPSALPDAFRGGGVRLNGGPPLVVRQALPAGGDGQQESDGASLGPKSRSVRFESHGGGGGWEEEKGQQPAAATAAATEATGQPRGSKSGGPTSGGLGRTKSHPALLDAVQQEAAAVANSPLKSNRMEFLQRLVAQNPLMAVVSSDFRVCARLSLQALCQIADSGSDNARVILEQALSVGVSDAEAAQCMGLITAFEERLDDKLQSLTEYIQTSFVSIGKKMDVPLPRSHMFELGRAMTSNLAVVEAEQGISQPSVSSASGSASRAGSMTGSARRRSDAGSGRRSSAEQPTGGGSGGIIATASGISSRRPRLSRSRHTGDSSSSTPEKQQGRVIPLSGVAGVRVTTSVVQVASVA